LGPPGYSGDVREVNAALLRCAAGAEAARPDVIIGGPPCQPFSVAAAQRFLRGDKRFKRMGHADKRRGSLFLEFSRLVRELEPRAFLLENVPGLLHLDGGRALGEMTRELEDLGYQIAGPTVLEASDFGIPQFRERLFVLGARNGRPVLPVPTHGPPQSLRRPWRTVAHALAGMPQDLANHVMRKHEKASIARYQRLRIGEREQLGRVDRLDPLRPSKTVIAGGLRGGGRSHLHPFIARTLSVRECARLQTFPDDYVFEGASARQFTQVGNAVPPLLGEQLAMALKVAEFGAKPSARWSLGGYLRRRESAEVLAEQLASEAALQKPEWLYHDAKRRARIAA
jgi:DNA (cytosine-5)-methyltransferase 1